MGRSLGRFKISGVFNYNMYWPFLNMPCIQKILDLGQEVFTIGGPLIKARSDEHDLLAQGSGARPNAFIDYTNIFTTLKADCFWQAGRVQASPKELEQDQ